MAGIIGGRCKRACCLRLAVPRPELLLYTTWQAGVHCRQRFCVVAVCGFVNGRRWVRRHVMLGYAHAAGHIPRGVNDANAGQAEVRQLDVAIRCKQQIVRLQVPVYDPLKTYRLGVRWSHWRDLHPEAQSSTRHGRAATKSSPEYSISCLLAMIWTPLPNALHL